MTDEKAAPKRKSTHLQAAGAVFWSFFGVRKNKDYRSDVTNLTPAQVIIAGLVGAALFVLTLLLLVYLVTR
jgi:hypothetical protein